MSGHGVFDYIVAGGGSAGCTLAARLAQAGDASVLLVEHGSGGSSLFSRMPAGNGFLFGNPRHDWGFQSTPQPGLGGRRIYYPRGRGLGGSSLMNGMIYIRGNAADYDRWRQMGLAGWSYGDVLPYFRRSAGARHRPGDPFHGTDGPLKLSPARQRDAIYERFVAACLEAGAPFNDDFNGATQEGAGWFDTKVWRGMRQSSARLPGTAAGQSHHPCRQSRAAHRHGGEPRGRPGAGHGRGAGKARGGAVPGRLRFAPVPDAFGHRPG